MLTLRSYTVLRNLHEEEPGPNITQEMLLFCIWLDLRVIASVSEFYHWLHTHHGLEIYGENLVNRSEPNVQTPEGTRACKYYFLFRGTHLAEVQRFEELLIASLPRIATIVVQVARFDHNLRRGFPRPPPNPRLRYLIFQVQNSRLLWRHEYPPLP